MADAVLKQPPVANPTVEALANGLKEAAEKKAPVAATPAQKNEVVKAAILSNDDLENLSDSDILAQLGNIEAKPLGFGEFLNVVPIDKKYYYRWVNKQSQRQAMARAQGFANATFRDVKVAEEAKQQDGSIAFDDVILMKLPKINYFQAQKYIIEKSARLGNKEDVDRKNLGITNKEIANVRGPQAEIAKKVSAYIPPIQQ
jgi:hypothetical protein